MTTIAKYIVMEETAENNEVRFFVCGTINDDKTFTGVMHDNVGGGNYQEALIIKDEMISTEEEWDYQVNLFDEESPISFQKLEDALDEIIEYNTDEKIQNYCVKDEAVHWFTNNVFIENMSEYIPYGLGNTTFSNGYQITETFKELEISYLLAGRIKAVKPINFENMTKDEKENFAFEILSEKTDFELVKGTYTSFDDRTDANRNLSDVNSVYDEVPDVESISSKCGEKLHYSTDAWTSYSHQLGNPKKKIGTEAFKELLETADLITVDGSPYLHTWDFEDEHLISTKYEEDGLSYEIDIDEDEVLTISKEKNVYKIVCENTDYKITLHTLGSL